MIIESSPWPTGPATSTAEFDFSESPMLVRVADSPEHDICNWQGEWIDPLWTVEPFAMREGMEGLHGWEMYGDSYSLSGECAPTKYRLATWPERLRFWLFGEEVQTL